MGVEEAQVRFSQVAYVAYLGVRIVEVTNRRAVLMLPFRQENINPGGILQGGATASLINMAGALAVWTDVDLQQALCLGAVDMSIQYLSPALAVDIIAEARVLRRGRDLFFLEVAVETPARQPISRGSVIYRAVDYAGRPRRLHTHAELLASPSPVDLCAPLLIEGPYTRKLRIHSLHRSPGRVRLGMAYAPEQSDKDGGLHEGALASLFDMAGTEVAWSLVSLNNSRGATVGMQLSYTGVRATEPVIADARLQQRSEELFLSTVQITTVTSRQLVAMGNVIYRLLEG